MLRKLAVCVASHFPYKIAVFPFRAPAKGWRPQTLPLPEESHPLCGPYR